MQLGMVGLGKMGGNIVRRLMRAGHECVVYDVDSAATEKLVAEGAIGAASLAELVERLTGPRAVWMMLPHGEVTESVFHTMLNMLGKDDVLIDGGNSNFQEAIRRGKLAKSHGVSFLDVGTSGGVRGLDRGYCMMIGGPEEAYQRLEPIFITLSPGEGEAAKPSENGYLYCGESGAGHYVKMIHNGIEYGMMQAFAEGFDLMRNAEKTGGDGYSYDFDLPEIAEVWRRGSVVTSWLLDLTAEALQENPSLSDFSSQVSDSGEGRWTVNAAVDQAVPAPVLTAALFARFQSRQQDSFAGRILSAMRYKFGGHSS